MTCIIIAQGHLNQGFQAIKLDQNPGLLPVKLGRAFVQHDKWSIIKTLNLEGIVKDLEYNIVKYLELREIINQNQSIIQEVMELKSQVEYLRDETVEKVRQLIPSKRFKRGLIDPLGSLIKVVTGNLDHDDAVRYDNLIVGLKNRQQGISNKITLISEMMDHFLNCTQIIDKNMKVMNERLKRIESIVTDLSKENMYIFISYLNNLLNMFMVNFRTLYMKINDLETALALSKVSVLHKSVIDSNELLSLLMEISKYDRLMYSVSEKTLINIEETLTVKTYLKENEIRFIIDVPLVVNCTYNLIKLYPLPVSRDSQTFIIIPEFPFLLVEGTTYRPIARQCREITSNEYLCTEDDIIPYARKSCAEQLMEYQSNLSMCVPRRVLSEDLKLQRITIDSWILYSKRSRIITQTCGDDITRATIIGTYILTIPEACDVTVHDVKIHGRRRNQLNTEYKSVPVINLPEIPKRRDPPADTEPAVDLMGVDLDDIQQLNHILKKSVSESENGQYSVQINSVSVATGLLYIILTACTSYVVYLRIRNIIIKRREREQLEDQVQPPVLLVSR